MKKIIVLASTNIGKIKEYQDFLNHYIVKPYTDFINEIDIIENSNSFKGNALIKAKTISERLNMPCIADDSGLLVEVLPNELGVKSKRFSQGMSDEANNLKLLKRLESKKNRSACFVTVICLYQPNLSPLFFEGVLEGVILNEMRGTNGFGYDPLFYVPKLKKTLAELPLKEKNKISHRHQAMKQLAEVLNRENPSFFR